MNNVGTFGANNPDGRHQIADARQQSQAPALDVERKHADSFFFQLCAMVTNSRGDDQFKTLRPRSGCHGQEM
jgi:hypothetical protein